MTDRPLALITGASSGIGLHLRSRVRQARFRAWWPREQVTPPAPQTAASVKRDIEELKGAGHVRRAAR